MVADLWRFFNGAENLQASACGAFVPPSNRASLNLMLAGY